MRNGSKISIIVPVYKVESYLRKCLDSIICQTYTNLQIILVDDGSPDNCGKICDEYAIKDERIEVIHQENGGLSAARNAGLALATGDYVGFVDSDDWIEPDMYEYLLNNALIHDADIAQCGHRECSEYSGDVGKGVEEFCALHTEAALELLLHDYEVKNYVWDKLYKRDLFQNIRFPVGRNYEDIAVMYKLFMLANKFVFLPEAKYNYLQRAGSIQDDISLKNKINFYHAARRRYEDMRLEWPQFDDLLRAQCVASAISLWGAYYTNSYKDRQKFKGELEDMSAFCSKHYKVALKYMNLGVAGRLVLRLTPYARWWAFALAGFCGWLYKLKQGRSL